MRSLIVLAALSLAACAPDPPPGALETHLVRFLPAGAIELDGEPVTRGELEARVKAYSEMTPQPIVQVHPETAKRYPHIAEILNAAFADGTVKVGVIGGMTEPGSAP